MSINRALLALGVKTEAIMRMCPWTLCVSAALVGVALAQDSHRTRGFEDADFALLGIDDPNGVSACGEVLRDLLE